MKFIFLSKNLLKSLYANKRQTWLTMGAMMIGIISILLVLSLGNGVSYTISKQLDTVTGGKNVLVINYISAQGTGGLTVSDANKIKNLKNIKKTKLVVNPLLNNINISVDGSSETSSATYDQMNKKYENDINIHKLEGEKLTFLQTNKDTNVGIKSTLAKKIFRSINIIGQTIKIGGNNYFISTVYEGAEETPDLLVTETVYLQMKNFSPETNQLRVTYKGSEKESEKLVLNYLKNFGQYNYQGTYERENVQQVIDQINKMTSLATKLIAGVAGISLIVAGFGVMSSTYSSIIERKEEIGLRRTFGATSKNIRNQFILEGLLMTIIAASLSVGFVLILSNLVGNSMGIRLIVTKSDILVAILIPTIISFIFTYFPAVSASRKNILGLLR
jgi:ABC-type transport system, involved in lipoprotein release, permease component